MACNVSGVVISMSGGLRACLVRSFVSVSPCLTASLTSRLLHHHARRSSMSRFNALSGVTYKILIPYDLSGVFMSILRTGRTAASVFPVAVGDMRRTFFPSRIFGMVFFWGSVGASNPLCSISLRMGLSNVLKGFFEDSSKKTSNPEARKIQQKHV